MLLWLYVESILTILIKLKCKHFKSLISLKFTDPSIWIGILKLQSQNCVIRLLAMVLAALNTILYYLNNLRQQPMLVKLFRLKACYSCSHGEGECHLQINCKLRLHLSFEDDCK